MTKYRPKGDRVLVRWESAEGRSEGGIILPDVAQQKSRLGKVVAVGDGTRNADGTRNEPCVQAGDRVLVEPHAVNQMTALESLSRKGAGELSIIREHEIIAVVEG